MASNRSLLFAGSVGTLLAVAWSVSAQQPLPALPPPASSAPLGSSLPPASAPPTPTGPQPIAPPAANPYGAPGAAPPAPGAGPLGPGTVPGAMGAQPEPGYARPMPPPAAAAGPTAPEAPDPGDRLHDGFFLRVAGGLSYFTSKISPTGVPGHLSLSGAGLAVDGAMGLAPVPGWIIGGRGMLMMAYNPTLKDDNGTNDKLEASIYMLQFITDIYPSPRKGLHLMAGVGPMSMQLSQKVPEGQYSYSSSTKETSTASGLSLTVGGGWETWVSSRWSLGGMITLNFAWMEQDLALHTSGSRSRTINTQGKISAFVPALVFNGTFN